MKPTENNAPSYLGELILLRLLSQGDGETPSAIEKAFRPMLKDLKGPDELRQSIYAEVAVLKTAGHIKAVRKSSFVLEACGKRAILATLGLKSVPANANWKTLKDRYLLICLFEHLRSAVPAPKQVPLPEDDKAFAQRVLAAARASTTGRFGDDKVFISHVLRQLDTEGFAVGDVKGIKDRLVEVNRRGLLSLNRADLIEAMDPKDVAASEVKYLNATFHFVRI